MTHCSCSWQYPGTWHAVLADRTLSSASRRWWRWSLSRLEKRRVGTHASCRDNEVICVHAGPGEVVGVEAVGAPRCVRPCEGWERWRLDLGCGSRTCECLAVAPVWAAEGTGCGGEAAAGVEGASAGFVAAGVRIAHGRHVSGPLYLESRVVLYGRVAGTRTRSIPAASDASRKSRGQSSRRFTVPTRTANRGSSRRPWPARATRVARPSR